MVVSDDAAFTTNVVEIPLIEETINGVDHYSGKHNFDDTKYFTIADKKEIVWLGGTSTWLRGSGASGSPDTNDAGRLLIVDAEGTANHATLIENVNVKCAYIKTASKLVVPTDKFIEIEDDIVLDGEIRLVGDGQLIQTHTGTSKIFGSGKLYKDQQAKVPSVYRYHYWSSPVGENGLSTFRVGEVMKDGIEPTSETSTTPPDINWIDNGASYDGAPGSGTYPSSYTPITIANHWIYTYLNGTGASADYVHQYENGTISQGQGYTMKSTGVNPQNFTFVGTPNDGTISFNLNADPSTHLLGNPYPSALDITAFINDNIPVIDGTVYFWEHTGEDVNNPSGNESHEKQNYQGGYSVRNSTMGISARDQPNTNNGIFDWESNTNTNGTIVTQSKTITIGTTDYDIIATVTTDEPSGVNLVNKMGEGGSTVNVIVKNNNAPSIESFIVSFDNLVDLSSINLYDINNSSNTITITANNPSRNSTITQVLTGNTLQNFTLNWTNVTSLTITTQNTNNIVLDDITFAKGEGISLGQGTYHTPTRYMAVGQGFFVSSDVGGTLNFENSQRVYRNDDFNNDGTFFFRNENTVSIDSIPILKLGINYQENNVKYHRQLGISFKQGNTFSYESGYDSEMFDTGTSDMYWKFDEIPNKKLIIAGVEEISNTLSVPLEFNINSPQRLEIMVDEKRGINSEVYLEDRRTGNNYNLSKKTDLNLEKGNYNNRFFLNFKNSTLGLINVDILNKLRIFIDKEANEIVIVNNDLININQVDIYTILGQKISDWKIKNPQIENRFKYTKFPNGFYILKLNTQKGILSKKIILSK